MMTDLANQSSASSSEAVDKHELIFTSRPARGSFGQILAFLTELQEHY